jgi:hypothetical protein
VLGNDAANVADASFVAAEVTLWRTDIEDLSCESWSRVDRYPLKSACDAS